MWGELLSAGAAGCIHDVGPAGRRLRVPAPSRVRSAKVKGRLAGWEHGSYSGIFYSRLPSCRISPRLLPLISPSCSDVFGRRSLAARLFCVQGPLVLRDVGLPYSPVTCQPERVLSVPSTCLPLNFPEMQETISWASDISLESRSLE